MGSIFSKPKMPSAPSLPTIIDTPAPTITDTTTTTTSGDPPAGSGGDDQSTPQTPDEARVQNILTRSRGRVGTITTSFNGVLNDDVSSMPARKTLLGE